MIHLSELEPYYRQYAGLDMRPLVVLAVLKPNSPVVAYHPPPYLDNLLARAVVDRATKGAGVAQSDEGYWLPIPLKMAWQSPAGFPLWDSSVFQPQTDPVRDTIYTHKRPPKAIYCEAKSIRSGVGRWMERRLPIPTSVSLVWEARCIGNAAAIIDLLRDIAFLGKRRSIGMGEVDEWIVMTAEFDTALVIDGCLTHGVPFGCGIECDAPMMLVGWTPPQWKSTLFAEGWAVGTKKNYDWFESA
jgi:hypothetical protein